MNLTVGPLPPTVYWRRRAIVLGGLLLVILLIAYSCSGSNVSNASAQKSRGPASPAVKVSSKPPTISTSPSVQPTPSAPPSGTPVTGPSTPSADPSVSVAGGVPTCTDDQIRVTPVISSTSASTSSLVHGGTFDLKLKIRNVSTTTCRRDVGSNPEELRVTQGNTVIWSSDACARAGGKVHDVRTFGPDVEIYAEVSWNSYIITTTGCAKSSHPAPAGTYSLVGRVGTATASVPFKIS